jgi:hypothetical protein
MPDPTPDPATAALAETGTGFCRVGSQPGTPVTAYIGGRAVLAIQHREGDFICTQDTGHDRSHAACDGQGHILARWPRAAVEHYWQRADCEGHDHG